MERIAAMSLTDAAAIRRDVPVDSVDFAHGLLRSLQGIVWAFEPHSSFADGKSHSREILSSNARRIALLV
jgi:hypothetical protein